MDDSNSANCANCDCENVTAVEKKLSKVSLKQTQKEVDELIEISRENVNKIMERDHNLSDLRTISESLEKGAADFKTSTATLKRQEWKKRVKITIIFAGIFLILFIIVTSFLIKTFVK